MTLFRKLSESGVNCVHVSPRSSLLRFMPQTLQVWVDKHADVGPRNMTLPTLKREPKGGKIQALFRVPFSILFVMYALLTYLVTIRPLLSRYVVVSDRYFYDLFYNLWGNASVVLTGVLPRPTIGFVLDIPVALAFSRMHSLEDLRIPEEYYELLRKYYLAIARHNGFHVIDTCTDFEKSNECIFTYVKAFLEKCDKNV